MAWCEQLTSTHLRTMRIYTSCTFALTHAYHGLCSSPSEPVVLGGGPLTFLGFSHPTVVVWRRVRLSKERRGNSTPLLARLGATDSSRIEPALSGAGAAARLAGEAR